MGSQHVQVEKPGKLGWQEKPSQDAVASRFRLPRLREWDLFEVTVPELQEHFSKGHFTAAEYTAFCLERIRVLNPYLEAVIETNRDALSIATELDEERKAGKVRGPLHGIPVLIKDNIATADTMHTTAGSWALLGSVVPKDAFVVSKLRAAGAVILGHTNMCEWASLRSYDESVGYSARGGQTRNPFDLKKLPFGSSSGSAVAISANFAPLAVGTETDTSIVAPAAATGIVGFKPTVGRTSRSGVIPISENMDSVGPMARTVADAIMCLDAIAGADAEDPYTQAAKEGTEGPYTAHLATSDALRGARFGLPIRRFWEAVPPSCKALATSVFDAMKAAGAEIYEVNFPSIEERVKEDGNWDWTHGEPSKSEWTVAKTEAYNGINKYLQNLVESEVRSIEDIVQYNIANSGTEGGEPKAMPAFPGGQQTMHEVAECKGIKDETYYAALAHTRSQTRENGIDAALSYKDPKTGKVIQLDALVICDRRGIGQQYAAQAGYPIICFPIGLDANDMPVSLSLQHSAWKERELVKWASAIEDLWRKQHGPRDIPTFKNPLSKKIPVDPIEQV